MTVEHANRNLRNARAKKKDEYYTQWKTIEDEINAYIEYNPDIFRDKVVFLPCDDPEWSNFTKFFALHFSDFGLKRLISTSYAPESNANISIDDYQPSLFEAEDPKFDPEKSRIRGKKFVLEREDVNGDEAINIEDLRWDYLEADGDFLSQEVTKLRDGADIIITNPPFSLFRTFVGWAIESAKLFSVIGSSNATTYRDIFRLIQANRLWKGATANNSDMVFAVPKGTPVKAADKAKAERLGYPSDDKFDYTRLGNSCWYANIQHGRRHEPLQLMTMEENLKFSKNRVIRENGYQRYVNFDAIEVPAVSAIPSDYDGVMGVPITYLDHHNPEQFEIIGNMDDHEDMRRIGGRPISDEFIAGYRERGGTGTQRAGGFWVGLPGYRFPFKRIFIRRKESM